MAGTDCEQERPLTRSKQRVADHGEVFTPGWLVEDMLGLVKDESARVDARFLEPACGSGNFLVPVLGRKLRTVHTRHGKSPFERCHHALLAAMSVYGIELLADNVAECRTNLFELLVDFTSADREPYGFSAAAKTVLATNIIHGDALSMTAADRRPITFAEWSYLGKGRYQRRDFRYDTVTQMSSWGTDTLFGDIGSHEIFTATKEYPTMTIEDLADA